MTRKRRCGLWRHLMADTCHYSINERPWSLKNASSFAVAYSHCIHHIIHTFIMSTDPKSSSASLLLVSNLQPTAPPPHMLPLYCPVQPSLLQMKPPGRTSPGPFGSGDPSPDVFWSWQQAVWRRVWYEAGCQIHVYHQTLLPTQQSSSATFPFDLLFKSDFFMAFLITCSNLTRLQTRAPEETRRGGHYITLMTSRTELCWRKRTWRRWSVYSV